VFHVGHVDDVPGPMPDAARSGDHVPYDEFETPRPLAIPDASGHGHVVASTSLECPDSTASLTGHGQAAKFSGAEMVTIPPFAMDAFTASWWMRIDQTGNVICPVGRQFGGGSGNSWQLCAAVGPATESVFFYTTEDPSTLQSNALVATLGSWNHYALTWDGTKKVIYVDRVEVASGPGTTRFDTGAILLGRDLDDGMPIAPLFGALDDVAIYQRALSADEIAATP
jgi:hypothetical protein